MDDNIIGFLNAQSCATVCTIDEQGRPWCFSCFYAFNAESRYICFKSSTDSYHSQLLKKHGVVAGTIMPDKLNKLLVQGVQFEGEVMEEGTLSEKSASALYYRKNPIAVAIPGKIWIIKLNHIKLTDSKMGFGKKLVWTREGYGAGTNPVKQASY